MIRAGDLENRRKIGYSKDIVTEVDTNIGPGGGITIPNGDDYITVTAADPLSAYDWYNAVLISNRMGFEMPTADVFKMINTYIDEINQTLVDSGYNTLTGIYWTADETPTGALAYNADTHNIIELPKDTKCKVKLMVKPCK